MRVQKKGYYFLDEIDKHCLYNLNRIYGDRNTMAIFTHVRNSHVF